MNFDPAFDRLIGHEGAFQDDAADRGNWTSGRVGVGECKGTKYGVSAMTYPAEDICNLTLERAKQIYRRDFWGAAGCDTVPDAIKFDLFDTAVNSGVRQAIKLLQKAVGQDDDGILGPHTLQAVQSMPPLRVVARFNGHRLAYMAGLTTWPNFSRGWARRIAANLIEA
jgi:lysozyme family protein